MARPRRGYKGSIIPYLVHYANVFTSTSLVSGGLLLLLDAPFLERPSSMFAAMAGGAAASVLRKFVTDTGKSFDQYGLHGIMTIAVWALSVGLFGLFNLLFSVLDTGAFDPADIWFLNIGVQGIFRWFWFIVTILMLWWGILAVLFGPGTRLAVRQLESKLKTEFK